MLMSLTILVIQPLGCERDINKLLLLLLFIIIITSVPEEQALRQQALFHYLKHKDTFTISHFQRTR